MTSNTNTFGTTCGRAIGRVAATTVHGLAVAAVGTGRFGQDVAAGASAGYAQHAERFAAQRAEATRLRLAAPANTYAVQDVVLPVRKTAKA